MAGRLGDPEVVHRYSHGFIHGNNITIVGMSAVFN